jgi:hypothetical protein
MLRDPSQIKTPDRDFANVSKAAAAARPDAAVSALEKRGIPTLGEPPANSVIA